MNSIPLTAEVIYLAPSVEFTKPINCLTAVKGYHLKYLTLKKLIKVTEYNIHNDIIQLPYQNL